VLNASLLSAPVKLKGLSAHRPLRREGRQRLTRVLLGQGRNEMGLRERHGWPPAYGRSHGSDWSAMEALFR